jgi:hypothetical protein
MVGTGKAPPKNSGRGTSPAPLVMAQLVR